MAKTEPDVTDDAGGFQRDWRQESLGVDELGVEFALEYSYIDRDRQSQ